MALIVYVAHQIAGNVEQNLAEVKRICAELHSKDIYPIAPYYLMLQYQRDENPAERALGMAYNMLYFHRNFFHELWLYGPTISKGMWEEIDMAEFYGIPVRPKTEATARMFLAMKGG